MNIRSLIGWTVVLALVALSATAVRSGWMNPSSGPGPNLGAVLDLGEAMGGDDVSGFARALTPRPFEFPDDHGPHPDFRTEWWYVTGNLETADGRRFGTQFTLFRNALAPEPDGGPNSGDRLADSQWATRQIYMGHFALTDVANRGFHFEERFSRNANGLAGATAAPFRVWLDDWTLRQSRADENVFPLEMRAVMEDGTEVDLTLEPQKPLVLQGDRGLSQKGPEPGNASFYYSYTRMAARGQIVVEGDTLQVTGTTWLDREWSTSALSEGQTGWDWFALQLNDGRDLMVYRLRRQDGETDPRSDGVVVASDGTPTHLGAAAFEIEPLAEWLSPIDGSSYPARWRVTVPSQGIDLIVEPVMANQELDVTVRYWEGAVDVSSPSGAVLGRGYVELTGYAGADPRRRTSSR